MQRSCLGLEYGDLSRNSNPPWSIIQINQKIQFTGLTYLVPRRGRPISNSESMANHTPNSVRVDIESLVKADEGIEKWAVKDRVCFPVAYATYHCLWLALLLKRDLALKDLVAIAHEVAMYQSRGQDLAQHQQPGRILARIFDLNWAKVLCDLYGVCREDPQRLRLFGSTYCSDAIPGNGYQDLTKKFFENILDAKGFRCNYHPDFDSKASAMHTSDPVAQTTTGFFKKFAIQRMYESTPGFCLKDVLYVTSTDLRPWAEDVLSFENVVQIALSHPVIKKRASTWLEMMGRALNPGSQSIPWCLGRIAQHVSNPSLVEPFSSLLQILVFEEGASISKAQEVIRKFAKSYAPSLSHYTLQLQDYSAIRIVEQLLEKLLTEHIQMAKRSQARDTDIQSPNSQSKRDMVSSNPETQAQPSLVCDDRKRKHEQALPRTGKKARRLVIHNQTVGVYQRAEYGESPEALDCYSPQ
ncbi:hypothetical protein TWF481_010397 [Arthrobotrys musiformis]|uniref:Uncharacterized protein n=1 Tax=Arthrobotrys musiformis TaxID=47236 RepID=A0AAV9W1T1_9PEZI